MKTYVFMQVPQKVVADQDKKLTLNNNTAQTSKQDKVKLIKNVHILQVTNMTCVNHISTVLLDCSSRGVR